MGDIVIEGGNLLESGNIKCARRQHYTLLKSASGTCHETIFSRINKKEYFFSE